jgi:hypothetical protein
MITKFNEIWASSGDTGTAPDSSKQTAGFVRREKAIRQLFNWLFNGLHHAANALVDHVSSEYDSLDSPKTAIATGFHDESWGTAVEEVNRIDTGSADITRICTCFVGEDPHLLLLDTNTDSVLMYNARTRAYVGSSGDLTTTITGSSVAVHDFCCDNSYIYVLFSTATNHVVGKFLIGGSGSWDYDSTWIAGGRTLIGTGAIGNARIKFIDADNVAVSCPWNLVILSTSVAIEMIQVSDGLVYGVGAGDCPTGVSLKATGDFSCDGTYLYFHASDGSSTHYLCSMTISAPGTGCGGTGYPLPLDFNPVMMTNVGAYNIAVADEEDPNSTNIIIYASNPGQSSIDRIYAGTPDNGNASKYSLFGGCQSVIHDGSNVWIGTKIETFAGVWVNAVIGIDAYVFSNSVPRSPTSMTTLPAVVKGPFMMASQPGGSDSGPRIAYDGRDIWACTGDAHIYRVPRVALR